MDLHQPKSVSPFTEGMGKTFLSRRYVCLQKCQQILISADKIWGEVPSLDDIFGSCLNIFPFCMSMALEMSRLSAFQTEISLIVIGAL